MKWLLLITALALVLVLIEAEAPKFSKLKKPTANGNPFRNHYVQSRLVHKTHKKRGLLGSIPTYSRGHDISIVTHSFLKPLVVKYPTHSVPVGVKIPFKPPTNPRVPVINNNGQPHSDHGINLSTDQKSVNFNPNVLKQGWNTNCAPSIPPTVIKPLVPVIPTVNVAPNLIPAPAITPLLPLPNPPLPFAVRPIKPFVSIAPLPLSPPFSIIPQIPIPVSPTVNVAHPIPIAPTAPIAPVVIKPGNSLHTSYFATFPKHPLLHVAHAAPLNPVPAPLAPLAPIAPAIPLGIAHPPLVHHIPLHLNKIPLNIPHPIGTLHHIPGNFIQHTLPSNTLNIVGHSPINIPLGIGEIPASLGQNPFLIQQPNIPFSSPGAENTNNPGVQEQTTVNLNGIQNIGGSDSNGWTPVTTSATFPNFQFTQPQFIPETESPTLQQDHNAINPNIDHNEGYHYQQNPGPSFDEVNQQQQYQEQQYHNAQFASNIQHEPQLPQALPDHPLFGRPISEEYHNHIPLRQHLPLETPSEHFANYSN